MAIIPNLSFSKNALKPASHKKKTAVSCMTEQFIKKLFLEKCKNTLYANALDKYNRVAK